MMGHADEAKKMGLGRKGRNRKLMRNLYEDQRTIKRSFLNLGSCEYAVCPAVGERGKPVAESLTFEYLFINIFKGARLKWK